MKGWRLLVGESVCILLLGRGILHRSLMLSVSSVLAARMCQGRMVALIIAESVLFLMREHTSSWWWGGHELKSEV